MDYNSLMDLLKQRRSIRAFKTDPVADNLVKKIVEAVRWAPSGMNTQPWEMVVVKEPAVKAKVADIIGDVLKEMMKNMPPRPYSPLDFANAPVFILMLDDSRIRPFMPPMDDMGYNYISSSNSALGFYNMLLAASTLGLGAQWMSVARNPVAARQVKEVLNIPDYLEIYAMMALGYAAADPIPKDMRETASMVHHNKCDNDAFRTEEDLKAFFKR